MNRFAKSAILAVAGFASVAAPMASAHADGWRPRHWDGDPVVVRQHRHSDDVLVGGLIGLTAGLILMDALKPRPAPVYRYQPQVNDYPAAPPAPRRVIEYQAEPDYGFEPWSKEWYRYCSQRYRSFDPETGTFMGRDGREHFCAAN